MQYEGEIEISCPISKVVDIFSDPGNLVHYQDGFLRKELVKGEVGQDGAVSKLFYQMGKKEMVLTETIVSNELPDRLEAIYQHPMMENSQVTTFEAVSEDTTRYAIKVDYTALNGIIPKIMAYVFPSIFTRQGKKWMANFKEFAEKQSN